VTVSVPVEDNAIARPVSAAEACPEVGSLDKAACPSGRCFVVVRCSPDAHTVTDVAVAACVSAGQARPATTRVRQSFEVVLPGQAGGRLRLDGTGGAATLKLEDLHRAAREAAAAGDRESTELRLASAARNSGVLHLRRTEEAGRIVRPHASPSSVRVVTYNMLAPCKFVDAERRGVRESRQGDAAWKARAAMQGRMLAATGADILAVQELWRQRELLHVALKPGLRDMVPVVEATKPGADDQVMLLVRRPDVARAQGRPVVRLAAPSAEGVAPTRKVLGPRGSAVCAMAILTVTAPAGDDGGSSSSSSSTGAQYRICAAVTHLRFVPPSGSDAEQSRCRRARQEQAVHFKREALVFARQHGLSADRGDVVVLTGDINMEGAGPLGENAVSWAGTARAAELDADLWRRFSSPATGGAGAYSGAFVSALGVVQARRRGVGSGRGSFVSHVTREGEQRGADYVMLAAPLDGFVASPGTPGDDMLHPADRVLHSGVLPECIRSDARMPYPHIGGTASIRGHERFPLHWGMPEGAWSDLSDHRPVVADIAPPVRV